MKKLLLVLTLLVAFWLPSVSRAVVPTIDPVPAATLLLPYFEVDLNNPNGITTLFSINNASATAILAHVTLWTDEGIPTLTYHVYLTGYDVQTINMRDVFNGVLPRTASAGQDPGDTISPKGMFSQDINFASCNTFFPTPPLPAEYIAHIRAAHTGGPSNIFGGMCSGTNFGDNFARGYVTVDTVNSCSLLVASDPGYFGVVTTDQNVLWGDYFYVDNANNFAQGDTLVHIEASATDPETSVAGQYTFYGRFDAWTAADHREPLVTNFAARYLNGGAFTGGTDLVVWRDPKVSSVSPFACGTSPSWYPLIQEGFTIFDEQEHALVIPPPPFWPPLPNDVVPFPSAAIRTKVGGPELMTPYSFGWIYLNLNTTVAAAGSNPPEDPAAAQAWVTTLHSANGRYSVGYSAAHLDSAASATHYVPGL